MGKWQSYQSGWEVSFSVRDLEAMEDSYQTTSFKNDSTPTRYARSVKIFLVLSSSVQH